MPRTKEYGQIKRAETREKILSSAVKLFAQKGLNATSAADIAKGAGVSVGLMYHYYKTKDEVFGALIKDALNDMANFRKVLHRDECPLIILTELVEDIIEEIKSDYSFSQWTVLLTHPLPDKYEPEWVDDFCNYHSQMIQEITILIEKGQRIGKFKEGEPAVLSMLFNSILVGTCIMHLLLEEHFIPPTVGMLTAFIVK